MRGGEGTRQNAERMYDEIYIGKGLEPNFSPPGQDRRPERYEVRGLPVGVQAKGRQEYALCQRVAT